MIHDAHAFRGEYIDLCAQVERWAVETIRSVPAKRTAKANKMPKMLGPKLDLVRELATDDTVFKKPTRVRALLAQIHPLMLLRADLAHATTSSVLIDEADEIYVFELPLAQLAPHFTGRFWLKKEEIPTLVGMLKQRLKELRDQKLKD